MALGGGSFLTENKVIPGSYLNFISLSKASATLSDRGIIALPMELDWGGSITTINAQEFAQDSISILAYPYTAPEMLLLREVFTGAKEAIIYRLNLEGQKASIQTDELHITAKYPGIRGNHLSVSIEKSVEVENAYTVITRLDQMVVDKQSILSLTALKHNEFVSFTFPENQPLWEMAAIHLIGGENGTVEAGAYQAFLDTMESHTFHTVAYGGEDNLVKSLFAKYTHTMREDFGIKFQTILHQYPADQPGIISVENNILTDNLLQSNLVYWVAGQAAGLPINRSLTNKLYDGELTIDVNYRQSALLTGLLKGQFLFHQVGQDIRVLDDVNTFVSFTDEKGKDFADNQVLRILDQIGNDMASLFNEGYMGKVQNDDSGRLAFWNDLVNYFNDLRQIRAIDNFTGTDITVEIGKDRKSVKVTSAIQPVSVMTKLYMTVIVR